jgi:[glutamine synthetase] adenylyltransferase / [glutamine synthetase]-adenylyl-L-tyrosine phosphorylase
MSICVCARMNGLLATSFDNLQQYLKDRAAIWELMAYLKLRPVAGDAQFGAQVEERALQLIFARAAQLSDTLAQDALDMRARLQAGKGRSDDYKFSAGGMLDVYFITRYLQLRHKVVDPPQRGTIILIDQLAQLQLITAQQQNFLREGYSFLRRLDHQVRLQLERPQSILPHNPTQLFDIARRLGFDNAETMQAEFQRHLSNIRIVYIELIK